jgi:hypothetical protein
MRCHAVVLPDSVTITMGTVILVLDLVNLDTITKTAQTTTSHFIFYALHVQSRIFPFL